MPAKPHYPPRKQTCDLLDEVQERSVAPEPPPQQTEGAEIGVTNGVDPEWGEELYTIVVEPDPRLEQLRRLDEWLSHLTVWQEFLLFVPFALVIAGITVWLNSVLPPVDPNLLFQARPFGPLP